MNYEMERTLGSDQARKIYGHQIQLAQADKMRKRAMDPNASKSMSKNEIEDALNAPDRIIEKAGGFTSSGRRPGQFVIDPETGERRFIPTYRDFVFG